VPLWKFTNKSTTNKEAKRSLYAVKSTCFKYETRSSDCSIARTADEIKTDMEKSI